MSKKTDKAYEKIIRAFGGESPDDQFDSFGDDDKNDIDKNFEKPNPEAEGKEWSDWDDEKEADTATEDVDLPIAPDDDDLEDEWGKQSFEEQKEDEQGMRAQQYTESFKDEDLKNVNEIFNESVDYDKILDFNSDRTGLTGGNRADDVSGTTDDEDNQEVKVGQNQEPNKELGSRKVQLAKEAGYIVQTNSLNVGEGYEDDMLDAANDQEAEDNTKIDKQMDQDWDNYVERDVGGEDPDEDADEGIVDELTTSDTTSPTAAQIPQDAAEKEGGIPSELLEQRHNEEIEASGHPENWTLSGEPRQIGARGAEAEQEGPEEPFLSGGAKAENPTVKDYYNSGQDILEEEKEITDRTNDLEDLATKTGEAIEWSEARDRGIGVVDAGSSYETEDGDNIFWGGEDEFEAQAWLRSKTQESQNQKKTKI